MNKYEGTMQNKHALYHYLLIIPELSVDDRKAILDFAEKYGYTEYYSVRRNNPLVPFALNNFHFIEVGAKNRRLNDEIGKKAYRIEAKPDRFVWQCRFTDNYGKRISKAFSVRKYGEEKAKRLAEKYWDGLFTQLVDARCQIAKRQGLDVFWENVK